MIIATYDEQRSFPEYVDMAFKDLVIVDSHPCPIWDWKELYELILDGYAFDCPSVYVPTDIEPVFGNEGCLKRVSKRRFKIFCQRIFKEHGGSQEELDQASEIIDKELEEIDDFFNNFVGPEKTSQLTSSAF
jgi:hypothetical protein